MTKSLNLMFQIAGEGDRVSHETKVKVPYLMLITGFKLSFIIPDPLEQKIRSILKPRLETHPIGIRTDCLEEWLLAWRDQSIITQDGACLLKIDWEN